MPRDGVPDRPRGRDGDRPRDRDHRDRDRGGDRHGRRDHSRSPRRDGGGRRSEHQRYRSRSPIRRGDRDQHRQPDARGKDREPRGAPTGPRGDRPTGPRDVKDERAASVQPPVKPEPVVQKSIPTEKPEGIDEDTWEMIKVMGFGTFKTTKETKVPGNDKNFGVRKDSQMKARQYMNRQGGFNRPLSPGR